VERETLPPQWPVHKVQCLLDWMMKKNSVKAAFQFASLDKSLHDGRHIYRSTAWASCVTTAFIFTGPQHGQFASRWPSYLQVPSKTVLYIPTSEGLFLVLRTKWTQNKARLKDSSMEKRKDSNAILYWRSTLCLIERFKSWHFLDQNSKR
jgi:hypothetical protein